MIHSGNNIDDNALCSMTVGMSSLVNLTSLDIKIDEDIKIEGIKSLDEMIK